MQKDRITKKYNNQYTKCSNLILQDARLSYEAVGIFAYLWSKNDDWDVVVKHLQKRNNTSEYSVRKALRELRDCGYMKWHRVQSGCEYFMDDEGSYGNIQHDESQHVDIQHDESQHDIYIQKKEINKRKNEPNKKYKKEKPSLSEIQEYITQENLPINAEQVLSYYDSTNWVKKNGKPVVNWKSTIKNWNRPTIAERKIDIENISFEVKEKSKNHTPYEKLQKIIMNKGISRNDSEIKNILQMEECQQWLKQTESNKTFEATLEDIQTHPEAQNVLKNAYISFLEKFKTSKEQIENDIRDKLPLFLTRCEKLRYTAVIEGLTTITKNDYNDYMKKQSENKLPFISHFDYIIQRIEFIDSEITRLWKKVNELLV